MEANRFNPGEQHFGTYQNRNDMEQMSETPQRASHRRAHSDTFFLLPDDDFLFDFDADAGDFGIQGLNMSETGSASEVPVAVNGVYAETTNAAAAPNSHQRSLSVGAGLFEGFEFQAPVALQAPVAPAASSVAGGVVGETLRMDGQINSMEGFPEGDQSLMEFAKKSMPAEKISELALIDPKRAKRILANRQSAARSKDRKIKYTGELENKVHTLQIEATTLSAQLTLLKNDTMSLTTENKELKVRLQAMEQQARLRDALNEALRDEVQRLKMAIGQLQPVISNSFNRGLQQSASPFFSQFQPQPFNQFGGQQSQQFHTSQNAPNGQRFLSQLPNCSMDFARASNNLH